MGTVLPCPRLLQLQGCYSYRATQIEVIHEVMPPVGSDLLGFVCLYRQSRALCDRVARGGPGLIVGQQSGTLLVSRNPSTPC